MSSFVELFDALALGGLVMSSFVELFSALTSGGLVIPNSVELFSALTSVGLVIPSFTELLGAMSCASSLLYILEPFVRLHLQHSVCKLLSQVTPPFDRGMI